MKGALLVGGTVTTGKGIPAPSPVRVGSEGGLLLGRLGTESGVVTGVMSAGGGEDLVVMTVDLGVGVGFSDVSESTLVERDDVDVAGGVVAGVFGLVEVLGPVEVFGLVFVFVFVFAFVFVSVGWVFCDRTAVARIPSTRPVNSGLFTLILKGRSILYTFSDSDQTKWAESKGW